jgi:hypothetical protein
VADIGCGKGASTVLMAKAFPKSQFFGFDYHDESIEGATNQPGVTVSPTASPSKCQRQKSFPVEITTLWPSSIAYTTWATRSGPLRTSGSPWPRMGRG